MLLDLLCVSLSGSQSSLWTPPQELRVRRHTDVTGVLTQSDLSAWLGVPTHPPHDGDGLGGEESWVAHFVVDDAVKHFLLVVTGEGRLQRAGGGRHGEVTLSISQEGGVAALTSPTSISKMRTPSPHQSTARV